ncbi:hypothetical protein D3C86_1793370 [compost metagenome]
MTGFLSAVFQPRAFQPLIHSVMPCMTYLLSVCRSTRQGRFRASSAAMAAISSMRLLVVLGSPPHNSFSWPAPVCKMAPQPPGPGLPLQAPSV